MRSLIISSNCCRHIDFTCQYNFVIHFRLQVNRLEITPEKSLLAAAGNPHVRMFDINSSNPHALYSYDGHTGNVTAVGFHMTGNWMYTGRCESFVRDANITRGYLLSCVFVHMCHYFT